MKPSNKQLEELKAKIRLARDASDLTNSDIARISGVHPSQVGRICGGSFRTFSHNVVQICKTLGVAVPRAEFELSDLPPEWAQALQSMRKIWDDTPEGARVISRILDAIAELKTRTL